MSRWLSVLYIGNCVNIRWYRHHLIKISETQCNRNDAIASVVPRFVPAGSGSPDTGVVFGWPWPDLQNLHPRMACLPLAELPRHVRSMPDRISGRCDDRNGAAQAALL
jgi:hypothetical protein